MDRSLASSPTTAKRMPPSAGALLAWYDRHRRRLPWRAGPGERADPYRVWLSEIMLQQTRVEAVVPYFESFLAAYPTVGALAAAPLEDVLRRWAGLGYYARARNLHACARAVVARFGSTFPDTEAGLRELPGIGPYTAAAIAAIAFDRRAAAIDGNVERVATRLDAIAEPLPGAKPAIRQRVEALVPADRPGDFAQALMDLGATICTPRRPACVLCPWAPSCAARAAGTQEAYPVKAPKPLRPLRRGAAFIAVRDGCEVLLRRRPHSGLLGGMPDFPGTAWVEGEVETAFASAPFDADWRAAGVASHGFTHFTLELVVFVAAVPAVTAAPDGTWWQKLAELSTAGLPTAMRKVAAAAGLEPSGQAAASARSSARSSSMTRRRAPSA